MIGFWIYVQLTIPISSFVNSNPKLQVAHYFSFEKVKQF